jgi:hypothetical protein
MRRLSLNRSEPAKKSGQNIPKNRCRTTIVERMVETLAELPFIGDQVVCLSHDQAARGHPAVAGTRHCGRSPSRHTSYDTVTTDLPFMEAFAGVISARAARLAHLQTVEIRTAHDDTLSSRSVTRTVNWSESSGSETT